MFPLTKIHNNPKLKYASLKLLTEKPVPPINLPEENSHLLKHHTKAPKFRSTSANTLNDKVHRDTNLGLPTYYTPNVNLNFQSPPTL